MTHRLRMAGVLAGAALVLGPGAAGAVEGSLYPVGAGPWAVTPQFSAIPLAGGQFQIQAPALNPAGGGNQWEMNWVCPVAGSEIHAVQFGALRTQAPSSLALLVTGNRQTLWSLGDTGLPQSPELGRAYDVRLPGGQCNVHLALSQVEIRAQHARGYFIDNPRVLVRDLTPPAVILRALTSGWINAASGAVRVQWTTSDNFGGDGVAAQRVLIAGQPRWTGAPGVGDHDVTLALDGIGDGVHGVEVRADGDGTGGGSATGAIHVRPDRAHRVRRSRPSSSGAPGAIAFAWRVADNLSGAALSQAEVNAAGDGSVSGAWIEAGRATGAGSKSLTATPALADGVHAWRIRAADGAGNAVIVPGPDRVVVDTTPPRLELHAAPTKWVNRVEIDLTATDNLQTALGLAPIEFDLNTAADAGEGGQWVRVLTSPGSAGRRIATVALPGLADGRHLMRVVARNGAPFAARLVAERRVVVKVDLTAPVIASSTFSPTDSGSIADHMDRGRPAGRRREGERAVAERVIVADDRERGRARRPRRHARRRVGAPRRRSTAAPGDLRRRRQRGGPLGHGSSHRERRRTTAAVSLVRFRDARLVLAVERARVERTGGRTTLVRRVPERRSRDRVRGDCSIDAAARSWAPRSRPADTAGGWWGAHSPAGTDASGSGRGPRRGDPCAWECRWAAGASCPPGPRPTCAWR